MKIGLFHAVDAEAQADLVEPGGKALTQHAIAGIIALATPKVVKVGGEAHKPDKKWLTKWR